MSKTENNNQSLEREPQPIVGAQGRILALDLGTKRVGVAISDELHLTVRPLPILKRSNWKKFLREVEELCLRFDVKKVLLGLPLRLDGTEGDAAKETRRIARNMSLTLPIPVILHDERYTSYDAERFMRANGMTAAEVMQRLDSESAVLILSDYLMCEYF